MNLHLWVLIAGSLIQNVYSLTLDPLNVLNSTSNILESSNIFNDTGDIFQLPSLNLQDFVQVAKEVPSNLINVTESSLFKNVQTFTEIANEAGLQVTEYEVTTSDGYILGVFHIESNGTSPVLLVHGILDSSDTFIIRRNTSLTKVLVDAGYDVWLMNLRGNKYSRKHVSKNPDTDKDYWDFSFNEMGIEDLPAVIDFVLDKTGIESLHLIGHSQGTTDIWVMGSEKPEYNSKVKAAIALAPVCFLQNVYQSSVQILIELAPLIAIILKLLGVVELVADRGLIRTLEQVICPIDIVGYTICVDGIINTAVGGDNDQLEPKFFKEHVVPQYPTSISVKNALHFVQVNKFKKFAKYDDGVDKNLIKYSSSSPPEYDLSKVTMKVFTFEGQNDKLATIKDTDLLSARLPNLVRRTIVDRPKMNHLDFVYGKDATDYLYNDIIQVIKQNP